VEKTLSGGPGHMRQSAYYAVTWSEHLKIHCRVIFTILKTKSTILWQVSQPASASKGSDMSELRSCFWGLAVTTLPWWASRSFIRPCLYA